MPRTARIRAYNLSTANPKGLAVFSPVEAGQFGPGRVTEGKCVPFGAKNNLPQAWQDLMMQSGTGYACWEKRKAFLEGAGLPPALAALPVPGTDLTAADFWPQLCSYGAGYRAVALLVRYNANGGIGEVHLLPNGMVRKTTAGTFLYNPRFGREGYKQSEDVEHLLFDNRPEVVNALLVKAGKKNPATKKPYGQPGQILYAYNPQAGEEDYALPVGWAGRADLETDAEYARFDLEEVRNGFFPNTIITLIGQQNAKTEDENGETEEDRTDDEIRDFTGNGTHPLGRKKVLVMDAATKDLAPIVSTFDGGGNLEKLILKRPAIAEAVCRHMGILPILIGLNTAGKLGQSQEIMNASELTQDGLTSLRGLLVRVLRLVLPGHAWEVGSKMPISFLPPEVLAVLTPDELRARGGYAATPAPATPTPAAP